MRNTHTLKLMENAAPSLSGILLFSGRAPRWRCKFSVNCLAEWKTCRIFASGALDTARKMRSDGIPLESIARYTGLTVEEIQAE